MAFENAIITKEDDEKYGLTNIFLKYNPSDKGLPDQWYWIIDKEHDCWLMEMIQRWIMGTFLKAYGYFITIKVKCLKSY